MELNEFNKLFSYRNSIMVTTTNIADKKWAEFSGVIPVNISWHHCTETTDRNWW